MRCLLIFVLTLSFAPLMHCQESPEEKLATAGKGLFPPNWTVVSVDEAWWRAHNVDELVHTHTAFTLAEKRLTVIRLSYVESHDIAQIRHALAHEAGHVRCKCRDEETAEFWAHTHAN